MQDFRKLDVWAVAHRLTLAVYATTSTFPDFERFGLASQLRRAASAVAINIAESCGTRTDRERARFLDIAMASAAETEYELFLSFELGYISEEQHRAMTADVQSAKRMLSSLTTYLRGARKDKREMTTGLRRH